MEDEIFNAIIDLIGEDITKKEFFMRMQEKVI